MVLQLSEYVKAYWIVYLNVRILYIWIIAQQNHEEL